MIAKDATTESFSAIGNNHGLYRAVQVLLVTILFAFVTEAYLSSTADDDTAPQRQLNHQIQLRMLNFHLAIEELVSGDGTVSTIDVQQQLEQALTLTKTLISSLKQPALQEAARALLNEIDQLGTSGGRRITDGEIPGSLAEQEFDAQFFHAFGISELIDRELASAAGQRDWFLQLLSILIAIMLAALGLLTMLLLARISGKSSVLKKRLEGANGRIRNAHKSLAVIRSHMEAYRQMLLRSDDGVVITDGTNTIRQVNAAYTRMSGYQAHEVIGKSPAINKSDRHEPAFYQRMWQQIEDEGFWEGEIWDRRKDGSVYLKWLRIDTICDGNDKPVNYVATFTDLSIQKQQEADTYRHTYYDLLTKLPNRYLFSHQLQRHIATAQRSHRPLGVITLNIDRFHQINDYHGFVVGDQLLKAVATRLRDTLRVSDEITRFDQPEEVDDDALSRVSGDAFSLLLPGLHHGEDAAPVVQRLFTALSEPFHIQGHQIHLSVSAGIAIYPSDASDEQGLLRSAERALARAKEDGGNCFHFYTEQMGEISARKANTEKHLREAINNGLLEIHYQPIQDLKSGQIEGVEALVRWPRGDRMACAAEFIPLAEENGLIIPMGNWVLQQACQQIARFNQERLSPLSVSVNLSPRQFGQSNLVERVAETLSQSGLEPQLLKLEITESAVMDDTEGAIRKMHELRELGVRLSMDDFGTGYSSLAYLKRYPVDELKIDRSFVRELTVGEKDAEITAAICSMGNRLHLRVVAEGVETDAQLAWLKQLECDLVQGFLIAKPQPLEELIELQQPLAESN